MTFSEEILAGIPAELPEPKPYDPAQYGMTGYPPDLGIFVHAARLERAGEKTTPADPASTGAREPPPRPSTFFP